MGVVSFFVVDNATTISKGKSQTDRRLAHGRCCCGCSGNSDLPKFLLDVSDVAKSLIATVHVIVGPVDSSRFTIVG